MWFQKIYLLVPRIFVPRTPYFCCYQCFLAKNRFFLVKNSTSTQNNTMRAVLEVFQFYFQFLQNKRFLLIKFKFYRPCVWYPASRLLQIGHKSEKWLWIHSLPIRRHRNILWRSVFLLSSLVIGPSFMSVSLLV